MPEKEQQPPPPPPANGQMYGETEAAFALHARERRKKKRNKIILYLVLFTIFQAAVVAIFATTILRVRTPRFRIQTAMLENFSAGPMPADPSFSARMNAKFSIKNANFGRYKYHDTRVEFSYRGTPIGEVLAGSSRVGWRSMRSFNLNIDLNFANGQGLNSEFANDLSAGILPITGQAKVRGRVELIFVMRKKRGTSMNCSMEIVVATQKLRNIVCR